MKNKHTENLAKVLENTGLKLETDLSFSKIFRFFKDIQASKISERYREFFFEAKRLGLADAEQLVPYIRIPSAITESKTFALEHDGVASAEELLKNFPPHTWGYYMPLSRQLSTLGEEKALGPNAVLSRFRSNHRLNMVWSGVSALLGGRLEGLSVIDVACNWGGFSIEGYLRGAERITGFDIRPQNIDKARRVASHFGAASVEFLVEDIFDYEVRETFDIVLNLGLMYHISKPFEVMKKTYDLTKKIAVIDTVVHREPFSGFILGTGEAAVEHAATAIGVELHPTYRALLDLTYMVGFKAVVELHGLPDPAWKDYEKDPYANYTRRCIVAIK